MRSCSFESRIRDDRPNTLERVAFQLGKVAQRRRLEQVPGLRMAPNLVHFANERMGSQRIMSDDRELARLAIHRHVLSALSLPGLGQQAVRGRIRVEAMLGHLRKEGRRGRLVRPVLEAIAQTLRHDRPDLCLSAGESGCG